MTARNIPSTSRIAVRATTLSLPSDFLITSRACVPIEPVAPSTATLLPPDFLSLTDSYSRSARPGALSTDCAEAGRGEIVVDYGDGEEESIESVQHSAVPRNYLG